MYAIMCSDRRKLCDEKIAERATKEVAQREARRLNQIALEEQGDQAPLYYVELKS